MKKEKTLFTRWLESSSGPQGAGQRLQGRIKLLTWMSTEPKARRCCHRWGVVAVYKDAIEWSEATVQKALTRCDWWQGGERRILGKEGPRVLVLNDWKNGKLVTGTFYLILALISMGEGILEFWILLILSGQTPGSQVKCLGQFLLGKNCQRKWLITLPVRTTVRTHFGFRKYL